MIYSDIGIGKLFYILNEANEVDLLLLVVEDMSFERFEAGEDFKCFILFDRYSRFAEDNELVYMMQAKSVREQLIHDIKCITDDSRIRYESNLSAEDYQTKSVYSEELFIYMQMSYQHFYLRFLDFDHESRAKPIVSPAQYCRLLQEMREGFLITIDEAEILKELEVLLPKRFNIAQSPRLFL